MRAVTLGLLLVTVSTFSGPAWASDVADPSALPCNALCKRWMGWDAQQVVSTKPAEPPLQAARDPLVITPPVTVTAAPAALRAPLPVRRPLVAPPPRVPAVRTAAQPNRALIAKTRPQVTASVAPQHASAAQQAVAATATPVVFGSAVVASLSPAKPVVVATPEPNFAPVPAVPASVASEAVMVPSSELTPEVTRVAEAPVLPAPPKPRSLSLPPSLDVIGTLLLDGVGSP